jgi:hypothetical protein
MRWVNAILLVGSRPVRERPFVAEAVPPDRLQLNFCASSVQLLQLPDLGSANSTRFSLQDRRSVVLQVARLLRIFGLYGVHEQLSTRNLVINQ